MAGLVAAEGLVGPEGLAAQRALVLLPRLRRRRRRGRGCLGAVIGSTSATFAAGQRHEAEGQVLLFGWAVIVEAMTLRSLPLRPRLELRRRGHLLRRRLANT